MTNETETTETDVVAEAEAIVAEAAARHNPYAVLGSDVSNLSDLDEIMETASADFTIAELTPQVTIGDETIDVPSKAIVRTDTNRVLGVHKPSYHAIPYRSVAEIALEAVGLRPDDSAVQHVGTIKEGELFFATIDLGSLVLDPTGVADTISRHLTVLSSHSGILPVTLIPDNIRLACQNQLPAIRQDAKARGFCAKHTKNALNKLELAKQALGIADAAAKVFTEQAEKLLGIGASQDTVTRTVNKLWKEPTEDASDRAKTVHASRLASIRRLFDGDTCSKAVGANRWAVYQAITEFCDHGRGLTAEKRAIASILPGSPVAQKKADALRILIAA